MEFMAQVTVTLSDAIFRCTKYMGALLYMKANEQSLQQGKKPIRVRSSWTSAMAPFGVFGRPQRFTTNGLVSEEMTLVCSSSMFLNLYCMVLSLKDFLASCFTACCALISSRPVSRLHASNTTSFSAEFALHIRFQHIVAVC